MNHPWQQPIRPLEVQANMNPNLWMTVLFIRPWGDHGWEVISAGGHKYDDGNAMLRQVAR